ncbi:MAG: hypothetical protein Q4G65_19080 [bacterium]|nr:hypothetical protein [bacterium]
MKRLFLVGALMLASFACSVSAGVPDLTPERVKAIKSYLAEQKCPLPKIDTDNYGRGPAIPGAVYYYGHTLDPLPKLKGFEQIGYLPDRDADDTGSKFLSAGLEMGTLRVWGPEIAPHLKAAGFKRARLNYAWRKIEKTKGVYDFSELDAWVDALLAAGIEPWFYGGYGNEIYYGKYTMKHKRSSRFWDAPVYHGEEAVNAWLNFFRAFAAHYKGKVRFYEIWNELNGRWYKHGDNADKQVGVLQASRDFAEFYRRTVETIRSVDPEAKTGISLGSLDSPWMFGLAKTDFPEWTDVWTYHGYRRSVEENVVLSLARAKALLRRRDGSFPDIVMGESGRGVGPVPTGRFNTRTEYTQAKFAARRMFFDKAMDAKMCNLFDVGDAAYGYFKHDDRSPRLAWYVIRALGSIFDGLEHAPDLGITYMTRGRQSLSPQVCWNAVERHAYRRKGVPLYAWWLPENLDIDDATIYGRLTVQSGCERDDNFKHPVLIDPIRRTVWDVSGAIWSGTIGEDLLSMVPADGVPYILTDLAIFDEYVK